MKESTFSSGTAEHGGEKLSSAEARHAYISHRYAETERRTKNLVAPPPFPELHGFGSTDSREEQAAGGKQICPSAKGGAEVALGLLVGTQEPEQRSLPRSRNTALIFLSQNTVSCCLLQLFLRAIS